MVGLRYVNEKDAVSSNSCCAHLASCYVLKPFLFFLHHRYNRPVSVSDIAELSGGGIDTSRLVLLGIAAALVTVGVIQLVGG